MIMNFVGFFITQMLILIGMAFSLSLFGRYVLAVGILAMAAVYGIYAVTETKRDWKEDK